MNLSALRANWRTSLSGIGAALFAGLTVLAALPYTMGDLATVIPAEWKPVVVKVSLAATLLLRVIHAVAAKDSAVVGNGTITEPVRVPDGSGGNKTLLILLAASISLGSLTACTWLKQPATKSRLTATGNWLLGKAANIALSSVVSAAQSQADASHKADWLDSLATGLRANATASFSAADVRALAGIWTPGKPHWQALADQLADLAQQATTLPPAERNEILAQAVQLAAQLARENPANAFVLPSDKTLLDAGGLAPFPIVVTTPAP